MDAPASPVMKSMSARELMTRVRATAATPAGGASTTPAPVSNPIKQPGQPLRRFSISSGMGFNEFTSGIRAGWQAELFSRKFRAAVLAEFIGMTLFVAFATGIVIFNSAAITLQGGSSPDPVGQGLTLTLMASFGFGLMITVLVFAIGDISGANLNPAVTAALTISRKMSLLRCFSYIGAQMAGACVGAAYIKGLLPGLYAKANATNSIDSAMKQFDHHSLWTPIGAELLGTYLLVFTVCCAADVGRDSHTKYVGALTPLAIGFVVFLAHLLLIPIDGCSINPARSFGSAVVAGVWDNHWVFWVGPLSGSLLASLSYEYIFKAPPVAQSSSSSSASGGGGANGSMSEGGNGSGRGSSGGGGYTGVGPEPSSVFGRDILDGIERSIADGSPHPGAAMHGGAPTAGLDNMRGLSLGDSALVSVGPGGGSAPGPAHGVVSTSAASARAMRAEAAARGSLASPGGSGTSVEMSPILAATGGGSR